jgi:hypothetical protein
LQQTGRRGGSIVTGILIRRHQQPFVETAEGAILIRQMHFYDPVFPLAPGIWIPHPRRIGRTDPVMVFVAGYQGVRKFANQVTGNRSSEQPAGGLRRTPGIGIKFGAGDIVVVVKILLDGFENWLQVGAQTVLVRIGTESVGTTDVSLPLVENRPQIEEDGVVRGNREDRWIVGRDAECIDPGTDDPFVPVLRNAKRLFCQSVYVLLDHALGSAGCDQTRGLDGVEQGFGLRFRGEQGIHPGIVFHARFPSYRTAYLTA